MKRFATLLVGRPLWVLAALMLITVVALHGVVDLRSGEPRIRVDPSLDRLLPDGDDERVFYDRAKDLFGSDEFVLLVLEAPAVFTPEMLAGIARATTRLEAEPGVSRVLSLSNATDVEGRDGELIVGPFYEEPPTDPAALALLRERVNAHPFYGGSLVSQDGGATAILVFLEKIGDRDFVRRNVSQGLADLAAEEAGVPVQVTGSPHIKARLSGTIVSELAFILPTISLITMLLCAIAFRSLRGVLLPMAAIALAVIWTLGAMGYAGTPINLISNIIPPLLLVLGFAGAMHVLSEYYEAIQHRPVGDRAEHSAAIVHVLEEMGLTIFVNGLTTMLGFLSLAVSSILAIRQFGIWSVVGVLASTILSLTFIPAVLALLGPPKRLLRTNEGGRIDAVATRIAEFDLRNRRRIYAAALALFAVALLGMSRIEVSSNFVRSFVARSPVRITFEALNERLGGLSSFFVVVESDEEDAFKRPENLRELRALQEWLKAQPEVGGTASLADGVMLLNRAFHDNDPAAQDIPDRTRLVKQLLLFAGDSMTDGFVDTSFQAANIRVRTKMSGSAEITALMERLDARIAELPQRLRARPTGSVVLLAHTMDDIARGQLESIASALVTIYLTLALLLTSLRVGLYALVPNLLPIAVYYGALGITGTPLDLSTSLVGAITLGIAVDDTVHYFARFALEARRLGDERRATVSTLRAVIRPVTFTTLGLCLGFATLAVSELRNQVVFGVLSAFTMAVGWVLELTLSPALCANIRIVTLWDLLRLDLGPEPQKSIPLFEGLSGRQARIFALMSQVVPVAAGERLMSAGDKGNHMYVVIDGELAASLHHDGRRHELSRSTRGDVVGEIALFTETRSADVDVVRDARLLRFGQADLERLGKRYPRIAVRVYGNLNRVLAARVLNTQRVLA